MNTLLWPLKNWYEFFEDKKFNNCGRHEQMQSSPCMDSSTIWMKYWANECITENAMLLASGHLVTIAAAFERGTEKSNIRQKQWVGSWRKKMIVIRISTIITFKRNICLKKIIVENQIKIKDKKKTDCGGNNYYDLMMCIRKGRMYKVQNYKIINISIYKQYIWTLNW